MTLYKNLIYAHFHHILTLVTRFASLVTVSVTLIGAILVSIFSPVFAPLGEFVKDSISSKPITKIISAMTFDSDNKNISKIVKSEDTIASNSITFNFDASLSASPLPVPSQLGLEYSPNFECSFDGAPFEDCVPPKSYGDLNTEVGHSFQVRAKGFLGNIDKTPEKFYFTTITSASIEGDVKNNGQPSGNAKLTLDSKTHQINSTTDSFGRFLLEGVGQGKHDFTVDNGSESRTDHFFVPAGKDMMNKLFEFRNMTQITDTPSKETFQKQSYNNNSLKGRIGSDNHNIISLVPVGPSGLLNFSKVPQVTSGPSPLSGAADNGTTGPGYLVGPANGPGNTSGSIVFPK